VYRHNVNVRPIKEAKQDTH